MSALVAAARGYMHAPFRHRGRGPRRVDCAGLVWCAYRDCGVELPDFLLYGGEPHQDGLVQHVRAALGDPLHIGSPVESILNAGDVLVMRHYEEPHHLAIVADYTLGGLSMIHADGWAGKVVEHRLAPKHLAMVTHVFRKPV